MKFVLLTPSWICSVVAAYLLATLAYATHPIAVTVYLLLMIISLLCQGLMVLASE